MRMKLNKHLTANWSVNNEREENVEEVVGLLTVSPAMVNAPYHNVNSGLLQRLAVWLLIINSETQSAQGNLASPHNLLTLLLGR